MPLLYVTLFEKNQRRYPVLKSLNKIVTFDLVIICSVLNCSPNDIYTKLEGGDIIIIERS